MPARKVEVIISGMEKAETEKLARKIQETIKRENRLNEKRIAYQINC